MKALCVLLFVVALPVAAQNVQQDGHAVLHGIAVDSLRGGVLRGAGLRVIGTARMGVTDSLGRFRIDSVPAGSHSVELFHELLDTLGVRVRTEPLVFGADSVVSLVLGIPSGLTMVRAKCGSSAPDQGAIMGMVLSADTDDALTGVNVRLSWTELSVGREFGIREEPRQHAVLTDAAGRYKFCGLPNELTADISAERGRDNTGRIPVGYEAAMLVVVALFLPTSDSAQVAAVAPGAAAGAAGSAPGASLQGLVVDSAGLPLAGAHVRLGSGAAVTDSTGRFALSGLVFGSQMLVVRRLGYLPAELVVHLTRRAPREVVVRLDTYVPVLEAVFIEARRSLGLERVGFTARQRSGLGRYLSPVDLAKRYAFNVSDFLRHFPPPRRGAFGRACTSYWVDGMRWRGNVDEFMSPDEVAAIEVYSQAFAPAEFRDNFNNCRVVVIWSKWKLGIR
ncbi:MAG: carboxypeptidase-like regulatory domain-containing protein [Gemmatimonadaceae bacterium]